MDIPATVVAAGQDAVAVYARSLASGAGERFAEMVALQQPPGTKGADRSFMEGRNNGEWLAQMPDRQSKRMVREAKAAGIDIAGKYYMGGLADKRAWRDPMAWVSGVDDVRRVAVARDLEVHGIVEYTPPQKPPPKRVDIDPGMLREAARKERQADPKLTAAEAREKARDRIVPYWKKKRA